MSGWSDPQKGGRAVGAALYPTLSSLPPTNQGSPISVGGVVYGWSDALGRYVAQKPARFANPEKPRSGLMVALGSSTVANSFEMIAGTLVPSRRCVIGEGTWLMNGAFDLYGLGYGGQNNATILTHLEEVLALNPSVVVLALSYNDLDGNTEASANTAFATLESVLLDLIARGIRCKVFAPHYNGNNWRSALHYTTLVQERCVALGVPVISGIAAICSNTDKVGTAKISTMSDALHVNDQGTRWYGYEDERVENDGIVRRILPGGSAQVLSEMFANPRMVGSAAMSADGFSGTGPLDWQWSRGGTVTTVVSLASDDDGPYVQLDCTSAASDDYISILDTAFTTNIAARAPIKIRAMADVEVVTSGLLESIRLFVPYSSGIIQVPNGNSSNFTGVESAGRRMLVSPILDTAKTGTAMASGSGLRISFSGAGTSTIRLRGISARESRW